MNETKPGRRTHFCGRRQRREQANRETGALGRYPIASSPALAERVTESESEKAFVEIRKNRNETEREREREREREERNLLRREKVEVVAEGGSHGNGIDGEESGSGRWW